MSETENIQDQIAHRIRAELVCCDVYEDIQAEVAALRTADKNLEYRDVYANAIGRATLRGTWHELCYWGEASARIAEGQCPGYETDPNICRCPCDGCKHNCIAHDETFEFESKS